MITRYELNTEDEKQAYTEAVKYIRNLCIACDCLNKSDISCSNCPIKKSQDALEVLKPR